MRLALRLCLIPLSACMLPALQPPPPSPSTAEVPSSPLPSWLRLGVELRGRAQFDRDAPLESDDRIYLHRLRLDLTLQPAGWLQFVFRGQDARAFGFNRGAVAEPLRNPFEIALANVQLGHSEAGWQLIAGRQQLSLGDERLLGADPDWDPFGLSWDAAGLSYSSPRWRALAFAGLRVQPEPRRLDHFQRRDRLSGVSLQWTPPWAGQTPAVVEPYLLWKRAGESFSLAGNPGHRDVITPGIRAQGPLPARLDYNLEAVLQAGHVAADSISAWAAHGEAGWKPFGRDLGARLALEFNYASGDKDPADGRHSTFDDLYPAGFNQFGIVDPFAWRNIRYPAISFQAPITPRWTLSSGFRAYWLSTVADGLYLGGDDFLFRNPDAASSHIGNQFIVSAAYRRSRRWSIQAGAGRLFAGAFLLQSGYPTALSSFYLSSVVGF